MDKIIDAAKTIVTLKIRLPLSEKIEYKTLITTDKHKMIEKLFDEEIWVSQISSVNQRVSYFNNVKCRSQEP